MSDGAAYLWMSLGVFTAIVFPILRAAISPSGVKTTGVPPWVKKYALILVFSAVTGVILLAAYLTANPESLKTAKWYTPFLFGFSWESAIEKLTTKPN